MLVGFPFDPSRYDIENNLFFYKILLLEYQLIKTLKDSGYHVIYKAHPDRLSEVQGLFNDLVDEYFSKPFEQVWRSSDLILFTYTTILLQSSTRLRPSASADFPRSRKSAKNAYFKKGF